MQTPLKNDSNDLASVRKRILSNTSGSKARGAASAYSRCCNGNGKPAASLIECRLETGRTHQIRVHLAHLGHPLLGDDTYGPGFKTKAVHLSENGRQALQALGRQALHAHILGFQHPKTGDVLRFQSRLPDDLSSLRHSLSGVRQPAPRPAKT